MSDEDVKRLAEEMNSRAERSAEQLLRQGKRLRQLEQTLGAIRGTVEKIEQNSQKLEKVTPRGLATRVPIEKLEEARRIVREAEATGQPIAPSFGRGDDDITGVWAVLPGGKQIKVPNQWIRGVALAALGGLVTWLASFVHTLVQHWSTP